MKLDVPPLRVQVCNDADIQRDAPWVLYWMIAHRRPTWNFALQRAVYWATELGKPLLILEPLRVGYKWASDRLHRFVIDGMAAHARWFASKPVRYYPYVEPQIDADKGLLKAIAGHCAVVVTDDFPCFFLPRMIASAAQKLPVRLERVDSNGILPLRAADEVFSTAYAFRRFLQRTLPDHLGEVPQRDPLAGVTLPGLRMPSEISERWPIAADKLLDGSDPSLLKELPIDHGVPPVDYSGGHEAAQKALREFLKERLSRYDSEGNHPDEDVRSGLSPYLHFGHVSSHQVFHELMEQENWQLDMLPESTKKAKGSRTGYWKVSTAAQSFLDELITWRELGLNMCWQQDNYDQYESLPEWARQTLAEHASDKRSHIYSLAEFEKAQTHDEIWNAAQNQLLREGRIHNYLRMLWGKKILEWTASPEEAFAVMIHLNDKYAVDGRDPNSYSGIGWVLGRYDRAWGPERPIFGKIRYMSSENTRRKLRLNKYLDTFAKPS